MPLSPSGADHIAHIKPSRLLLAWIVLASGTAMVLSGIYLPWWGATAAIVAIIVAAIHTIRRDTFMVAPESIIAIRHGRAGMAVLCRDGQWHEPPNAVSLKAAFVSRGLVVATLRFAEDRLSRHVVLVPDSLEKDAARRLRLWLRWWREPQAPM